MTGGDEQSPPVLGLGGREPARYFMVLGDNAAADLVAGISGRLCSKVIRRIVNNQGTADDFRQFKPIGIKGAIGVALVAEKGRQIAGMVRMRQSAGVIVHSGLIEGKRAVSRFVNVHTIELAVGGGVFIWQAIDFRLDQHAAGRNRIETGGSVQGRVISVAGDLCVSVWVEFHFGIPVMSGDYYRICAAQKFVRRIAKQDDFGQIN